MHGWSTATKVAWWCAVGWAALLVLAAFTVPAFTVMTDGADYSETLHLTLVQSEGLGLLPVLCTPLAVALLTGAAMASASRWALTAAWVLVALLGMGTVLAMMSIGIVVLPVTLALIVAAATRSSALHHSRTSGARA